MPQQNNKLSMENVIRDIHAIPMTKSKTKKILLAYEKQIIGIKITELLEILNSL